MASSAHVAFPLEHFIPEYLANLLMKRIPPRGKRSARDERLVEIKRTRLVTAGGPSFVHVAPKLWNELPYSLRASNSLVSFKKLLKTFIPRYFCKY